MHKNHTHRQAAYAAMKAAHDRLPAEVRTAIRPSAEPDEDALPGHLRSAMVHGTPHALVMMPATAEVFALRDHAKRQLIQARAVLAETEAIAALERAIVTNRRISALLGRADRTGW